MSWLSNLFAAPGQSQANQSAANNAIPQNFAAGFLPQLRDTLTSQFSFANSLEPLRQEEIKKGLNMLSPQGLQGVADENRRGLVGSALDYDELLKNILDISGGGGGIGLKTGAVARATNSANETANNFQSNMAGPKGQAEINSLKMELLKAGVDPQNLALLERLAGIIYGRPQVQVGTNPLVSILSGAASGYGAAQGAA